MRFISQIQTPYKPDSALNAQAKSRGRVRRLNFGFFDPLHKTFPNRAKRAGSPSGDSAFYVWLNFVCIRRRGVVEHG